MIVLCAQKELGAHISNAYTTKTIFSIFEKKQNLPHLPQASEVGMGYGIRKLAKVKKSDPELYPSLGSPGWTRVWDEHDQGPVF